MIWTLPPLVLLIAQLQFHYGYESLQPGHPALVKATLRAGDSEAKPAIRLEASGGGLEVKEPPIWIPSLREMAWRIEPVSAGDYELKIVNGSETVTKTVRVMAESDPIVRRSPLRVRGFVDELLYPAEPPLPGGRLPVHRRHLPGGERGRLRLRAPLDDRLLRSLHRFRLSAARRFQSHHLTFLPRLFESC